MKSLEKKRRKLFEQLTGMMGEINADLAAFGSEPPLDEWDMYTEEWADYLLTLTGIVDQMRS